MEAIIATALGYAVRYGIPAAIEMIDELQKPTVTLASIRDLLGKHNQTVDDYLAQARLNAGKPAAGPQPIP